MTPYHKQWQPVLRQDSATNIHANQMDFLGNKMTNFMKPKQLIDIYQMSTGNAAKPNQKKTGLIFRLNLDS